MIFPLPSIWFDSPVDDNNVALRVDRFEDSKRHRMAVGIHLTEDFETLYGSLLIVAGHGKYLQSCSWSGEHLRLPTQLRSQLNQLTQSNCPAVGELSSATSELAIFQSQLVEKLKQKAGKYVDRILALCITDPGLWLADFDGKPIYHSISAPNRIADQTGINVIDAFPACDVACEGSGKSLEALPLWLMFADRDRKEATRSRVAILADQNCQAFFLPGSDGLDAELPAIQSKLICGDSFFESLAARAGQTIDEKLLELVALNGKTSDQLISSWNQIECSEADDVLSPKIEQFEELASTIDIADALRSCIVFGANQITDWLSQISSSLPIDQIIVCGKGAYSNLLTNELSNRLDIESDSTSVSAGPNSDEIKATLAAMLGFLSIDQMPASLPWLTGCGPPQVLGRITAGRPASWRQLLIEMADYRPPVMKLKDAV